MELLPGLLDALKGTVDFGGLIALVYVMRVLVKIDRRVLRVEYHLWPDGEH